MREESGSSHTRIDRRRQRTRRQLLQAVIELLLEKGYEDTMTDEITDRADVGRRTFYNHFVNKRDCVIEALKGRFMRYAEEESGYIPAIAPDRDEALVVATMAYRVFLDIAQDPVTERLMHHPKILSEAIAESQRDYMTANLARGLASHRLQPALPVESLEPIMAWGFVGLVTASIGRDSQAQDGLAWARFVLHNFGLGEAEIQRLLAEVPRWTPRAKEETR